MVSFICVTVEFRKKCFLDQQLLLCFVGVMFRPPSLQPTTCHLCGKTYSTSGNLRHHIKEIHAVIPEDQWETCELCGKRFKVRRYLINHLADVHKIYQKK